MITAKLGSYIAAAGLLGLGLYHLSIGDFEGAATSALAAFGFGAAAHSGPGSPILPRKPVPPSDTPIIHLPDEPK
jgi:hypothetical protein